MFSCVWVDLSVVNVSLPCSQGFIYRLSGFPQAPQKPNSNSIWNSRTRLNEVLKKRFVGKQNYKSVDPNSQLRSQGSLLPVLTERERERERLVGERTWERGCQTAGLKKRKVFASHSFLFKHITNMTGRFLKTLQMRITKKRRLKLKKGEFYKLFSLTEFSLAYRQVILKISITLGPIHT